MSARKLLDACASGDKEGALGLISGGCDPQRTCNEVGKTPLHIACLNGHFDIVLLLLHAFNCNPNRKDHNQCTPLHDACLGGHINVTLLLIHAERVKGCAEDDSLGETILHKACQSGSLPLVSYLVDYFLYMSYFLKPNLYEDYPDVYHINAATENNVMHLDQVNFLLTQNCDGDTPFHVACRLGHTNIIKYLSKRPLLYQHCALSVLRTACRCGHFEIAKYLVKCDPKRDNAAPQTPIFPYVQPRSNLPPETVGCDVALRTASLCGNYDIARYMYTLQEQTSNPMYIDSNGNTALHVACICDSVDIVNLLVHNHECEQQNNKGSTPLHFACVYGSVKSATFLLNELKCDPNVRNKKGETPLHLACMHCRLDICKLLLNDERCDVMICNSRKETPLHIASCHDCPELTQLILEKCCFGQDLADCYGDTPLFNACRTRSIATVRLLTHGCCYPLHVNKYTREMPVHIACRMQQLDILPVLLEQYGVKIDQRNVFGETPLHIACNEDAIKIVQFLLQRNLCDLNVQDARGYTAMHIACSRKQTDILECLLMEENIKFDQSNEDGDTILHLACYRDALDIVMLVLKCTNTCTFIKNNDGNTPVHVACKRKLCNILKCILESHTGSLDEHINSQGETPLHVSCTSGALDIVQFLLQNKYCDPCVQNKEGNTALHCACMNGNTDIVKYLITHTIINPSLSNHSGNTPLHCACEQGFTEIAEYLLTNSNCDPTLCNNEGFPPLISAFCHNHYDLLKLIVTKKYCDVNLKTNHGYTILHYICGYGKTDLVRFLVSSDPSEILINHPDTDGNTALHLHSNEEVLRILLASEHCDPMCTNKLGNTPLHVACSRNDYRAVEILLSNEKVDLCVKNVNGKTPIQLARNYSIIRLLIGHGANPNDVYEHYGTILDDFRQRQPLHASVKILVLGNSSMGKTTLIEALKTENSDPQLEIPPVQRQTVGIVKSEHKSNQFGQVSFYDFAGQAEYYSTHSAFLESAMSSSPPVLILLVSVESSSDEIIHQLQYWFAFLENHCHTTDTKAHVIIVSSHCDMVSAAESSEKLAALKRWLAQKTSVLKHFGPVLLDCRKTGTDEMAELQGLLEESCSCLRVCVELDCRCHVLFAYLFERFPDTLAITVCDLSRHIRKNRTQFPNIQRGLRPIGRGTYQIEMINRDLPLPYVLSELFKLLTTLSDSGHILLLKDVLQDENSWIILDEDSLYHQVNGVIFAPKDFEQHHHLASNTGVMPSSKLSGVFPDLNLDMVKRFLVYSELAQKIEDVETLRLIGENKEAAAIDPSETDEYYFFPGLVSVEKPPNVWDQSSKDFSYQCGWYLQCKPEQLLTNRFLHVLLLRLVFSFAAASDSGNETAPLNRRCSIWKNGIKWSNRDGVEVLVEVTEQSTVVLLLIRCFKGQEMKCVQLRSAVIRKILDAKRKFSSRVEVEENFIHPSEIVKYPNMNIKTVSKVSICEIAKAIKEGNSFVFDQHDQIVRMEDLLHFEPYEGIGRDHLNPLYLPEKAKEEVSTQFLYEISKHCHSKCEKFAEILQVPPSDIATHKELHAGRPDILLLHVLEQSWRDSRSQTGTYEELREKFDHYSIWCNRNPFVSVRRHSPGYIHVLGLCV